MDGISHRIISTNGIRMHIAELGSGPVVLFLHGFPECWYSWRKQMAPFSAAGYHVVAPDLRGYGDTDAPQGADKYTYMHIVGDLIGLLDVLQCEKAFVVSHDWGAIIGWYLCLFRPDRVVALATLSVYFVPYNPKGSILQLLRAAHGEDFYMCRFQEPGRTETMIEEISTVGFYRKIFSIKITDLEDETKRGQEVLPDWISEEDIAYYVKAQNCGFTPLLNYYRALDLSWELTASWASCKVMVPTLFMIGDKDIVYDFHKAKEYIHDGGMAKDVPNLKDVIVLKNVGHFLHEEKPDVVNDRILDFFRNFNVSGKMKPYKA